MGLFKLLEIISRYLAKYTALFVVGAGFIAYYYPHLFTWVSGTSQMVVLGVIMLAMGMSLHARDYKILAQHPFDICLGAVAQFTIMPLAAFAIAKVFSLSDGLTLGLILVGSCPGGVSSNIMSFLCKGDVAYSVGMTTVSTLLAPVMTPLLVTLMLGTDVSMDGIGMVKFLIIVTLIPVGAGSLCNIAFGEKQLFKSISSIMPGIAVIAFACIVGGVIAVHGEKFLESGLVIFACIFMHNTAGYILGYLTAKFNHMNTARRRTLSIEVGVQNAGLATGLSSKFFPTVPEAAIASAVSCVWHSISGTILANLYLWFDNRKVRNIENRITGKFKPQAITVQSDYRK